MLWKFRQEHITLCMVQVSVASGRQKPAYTTIAAILGHLVATTLADRELTDGVWSYRAAFIGCQFSAAHMVRTLGAANDRQLCLARFAGGLDPPKDAVFLKSLL